MIEASILPALHARLAAELAPPTEPLRRFEVDGALVGELTHDRAARLAELDDVFEVDVRRVVFTAACATFEERTAALDRVTRALAAQGALTAWRDERYEVRASPDRPPAFLLERAAARYFGVPTHAVHVNGLVDPGPHASMWIARRSPSKSIDPGMLDNLVAGGLAAGATIRETLAKEAWEEAGIDPDTAGRATPAGVVHVRRMQPDGLQRETIHVHDLWLPRAFAPANQDGEAVEHRLVPLDRVPALLANDAGPDAMTADASLVALDALIRLGAIDAEDPFYPWLAALCGAGR